MNAFRPLLLTTLAALYLGVPPVHAQDSQGKAATENGAPPDYGGWGMGPGYGMGPGMMWGGYGMGPGMHGYGMGPGMHGYGMGPGMMGGWGPGWGGYGPRDFADLTPEQREKIGRIQDETRKKNWELMGKMMDEQARLRDLYDAPKQDSAAISDSYKKIGELQRRMYESSAEAHKRMEAVLTKEQKEKSWRFWRHWW